MIIGIDGNEANTDDKVGVQHYSFEILWALYRLQDEWKGKHKFRIYLKNAPRGNLPREFVGWNYKILRGKGVWILSKLTPHLLMGEKPDVFFSPHHYLPPIPGLPKMCTIHDLGYLMFSGQFKKYDFWQLKYWSAISIIISKYIICPSQSVKKDIVRHYSFTSKKAKVVYHGYDNKRFNTKISQKLVRQTLKKYRIEGEYILFLSTLKPSKNIEGLVKAFDLLREQIYNKNLKLVIAGKKGWLYESIFAKVRELGLTKRVIFTDYLPEKEKPALISGAKLFVLPSFWEGFGIDVLEAMACGTPVVVSNVASLPEVAGDAGIYVDPDDVQSITDGIKKVLNMDAKRYNKQVELSLKQVKKFSWEKAAKQTLKILESV